MASKWGKDDTREAVDAFVATLAHPHKSAIDQLRYDMLAIDSTIAEGIKWKVPSFRTSEYFATLHLRQKVGLGLILHFGAKARSLPTIAIDDPHSMLQWLAADRAMLHFADVDDVKARRDDWQAVIRQWIRYV
jgi:hypothetical protein